jgi:ribose/xylose/arabinose/galactoside ABC-type transport system permease subunit
VSKADASLSGTVGRSGPAQWRTKLQRFLRAHVTYVVFGLITLFFILYAPNFASWTTASAILRITSVVSIMAIGMTMVIVCREIDLSVGALASLSALLGAMLMRTGIHPAAAIAVVLVAGALAGLLNGLIVTRLKVPSFLVTLGMLSVYSGTALTLTNSLPVPFASPLLADILVQGRLMGIAAPIWWTIVFGAVGSYLLHASLIGRHMLAVGGNESAARFSGVDVERAKLVAFAASSACAAFAGFMLAARASAGNPSVGIGLELNVIAATIIGGTSLFGGRGTVIGSIIGAVFIGVLAFGLIVIGFSSTIQEIVKGVVIILAVSLNRR